MPRAVIFDVDGVLLQSMERNARAYQETLATIGINIDVYEVFVNEGRPSKDLLATVAKSHGRLLAGAELDRVAREKQALLATFGPMPVYPGVANLLATLQGWGLRLAFVSGGYRVNIHPNLGDLLRFFEVQVTADDELPGKPSPAPYEAALRKLGIAPDEAVVVENAPLGIEAAKSAGIYTVGVTTTLPARLLWAADQVVDRTSAAEGPIGRIVKMRGTPPGGTVLS
ncbi:MAG: HAD family hydrolase [Thermoplasmatota archaeon]